MKKAFLLILLLGTYAPCFSQQATLFTKATPGFIDEDLQSIAVDAEGNKWIGTSLYGVLYYDGGDFVNFGKEVIKGEKYIEPIFVDSQKRIWIMPAMELRCWTEIFGATFPQRK